jgi:hypothetical protein
MCGVDPGFPNEYATIFSDSVALFVKTTSSVLAPINFATLALADS